MDVDALGEEPCCLDTALDKLDELFLTICARTVEDEENVGEEHLWEELLEIHFSGISMQDFLTTDYDDDGEWKFRAAAFSSVLQEKQDFIAFEGQDFSLSKIEDLNHELNCRLCM